MTDDYPGAARLHKLAAILTDLDRCPHGRHRGDTCAGWQHDRPTAGCEGGRSLGNPHMPPGATIGYNLAGAPYVAPSGRQSTSDPQSWQGQ